MTDKLILDLLDAAKGQRDRAVGKALGPAVPGPHLRVIPSQPISEIWRLEGLTTSGQNFIQYLYPLGFAKTNRGLRKLRDEAEEFGLEVEVTWEDNVEELA